MEWGKYRASLALHEAQPDDRGEKHDLPVEQARRRQIAADQAINAEIDEWRERPDVVFIERHGAQLAGDKTAKHAEGQRRPLAVQQRGQGHQHAAQNARPAAADHAQQKRGLETQISGQKALAENRIHTPIVIGKPNHNTR